VLSQGIKSPLFASLSRIVGKSVVQGITTAGVRAVQTGGDVEEATKAGLFAAGTRGILAVLGESARALGIPERLYSMIFKNTKQDMLAELRSDALLNLQRTNPSRFKELSDAGIIMMKGDTPVVNETLAEKALCRPLQGP